MPEETEGTPSLIQAGYLLVPDELRQQQQQPRQEQRQQNTVGRRPRPRHFSNSIRAPTHRQDQMHQASRGHRRHFRCAATHRQCTGMCCYNPRFRGLRDLFSYSPLDLLIYLRRARARMRAQSLASQYHPLAYPGPSRPPRWDNPCARHRMSPAMVDVESGVLLSLTTPEDREPYYSPPAAFQGCPCRYHARQL